MNTDRLSAVKSLLLNDYAVAVPATLFCLLVSLPLQSVFPGQPPVQIFLVGVLIAAWHGGFRAGFAATMLSVSAMAYFLTEPRYSLRIAENSAQLRLALFSVLGSAQSLIISLLRNAEKRALRKLIRQNELLGQEIDKRRRAESALNAANIDAVLAKNRLEAVMEALPVGMAIIDSQGGQVSANRAFDEIWGNPRPPPRSIADYAAYQAWWLDTGSPVQPEEWASAQAVRQGQTVVGQMMRIARFDGTKTVVHNSAAPIYDAAGRIAGCAVAIMDISESLAQTQTLRENEERYRLAIEAARLGTWDWDIPSNRALCNAYLAGIFGYPPKDDYWDYQAFISRVHAEDLPRVEAALAMAREQRRRYSLDYRIVWSNGAQRWVSAMGDFQYDGQGRPIRMLGVLKDITGPKQAEAFLIKSRLLLRTFVQQAPVSMAMFDRDMNYLAISNRWLNAYCPGQDSLIGQNMYRTRPDWPEKWKAVHRQGLAGASLENDDDLWIQADGGERRLRWAVIPWTDENGETGGIIMSIEDITDQKQILVKLTEQTQKLQEADRRKDEFLAMLAHELRNPLAPIRNTVEIMKIANPDPDRIAWCRDIIDRQIEHLTRLVDDLLDVSRINRGLVTLKKEPLLIQDFIQLAMETNQPLMDARRQTCAVTLPAEPLWVEGDRIRLAQAVSNLINNAAKYTGEGGHIGLSAEQAGDDALIRVRDSGYGIDPADLPRLFDLFYQTDRSLDRSQGGLGIGLAIVHNLVSMHGGDVRAFSEGRGKGCEFVIRLPRLTPHQHLAAATALQAPPPEKLRILVVDDNRDAAGSLALLLELEGHQVRTAHDGLSALAMARTGWPQAVLLDIGLPGIDGYSVAQALRRGNGPERPLLIAMTGYGQSGDREHSLAAGFDEHLVKPVDFEALRTLLTRFQAAGCQESA